jgi:hypothetical protein
VYRHSDVFNLLKINGGFEIFAEGEDYHFDYRKTPELHYLDHPPLLILPSREQDYTGPYFGSIFPKAVRLLSESKVLVIVGYSLPEEDALLRFMLRHFCEDEADTSNKTLFYVSTTNDAEQLKRLTSVFPFAGWGLRTVTHSGSFSDWASEVVSLLRPTGH